MAPIVFRGLFFLAVLPLVCTQITVGPSETWELAIFESGTDLPWAIAPSNAPAPITLMGPVESLSSYISEVNRNRSVYTSMGFPQTILANMERLPMFVDDGTMDDVWDDLTAPQQEMIHSIWANQVLNRWRALDPRYTRIVGVYGNSDPMASFTAARPGETGPITRLPRTFGQEGPGITDVPIPMAPPGAAHPSSTLSSSQWAEYQRYNRRVSETELSSYTSHLPQRIMDNLDFLPGLFDSAEPRNWRTIGPSAQEFVSSVWAEQVSYLAEYGNPYYAREVVRATGNRPADNDAADATGTASAEQAERTDSAAVPRAACGLGVELAVAGLVVVAAHMAA